MKIEIQLSTVSALNVREHWRARARRVKFERESVAWALAVRTPAKLPCVVTMTRLAPSNGLDDDNLQGAFKGVRDQIAEWLGVDDKSPLVTWAYAQRRARDYGVTVEVSAP